MVYLQNFYRNVVIDILKKKFNFKSAMAVPRIKKIVLNVGLGKLCGEKKKLDDAFCDLLKISGQKPIFTKSRKAIAGFKIRKDYIIGVMVTLRRKIMYEFLDRLINIALPRIRDFRGLSNNAFDGFGNYNIGIKEQIIFPEISYDKINILRGLNISIITSTNNDIYAMELLKCFKFPLKK